MTGYIFSVIGNEEKIRKTSCRVRFFCIFNTGLSYQAAKNTYFLNTNYRDKGFILSINERFIFAINELISGNKATNKAQIAQKINVKASKLSEILNKRMNVGIDTIALFSQEYSISTTWLLTGQGSMWTDKTKEEPKTKNGMEYPEYIPLVEERAIRFFGKKGFDIQDCEIKKYYYVPKFNHRKIDFMIEISGTEMYPQYNSGDIAACMIIHNRSFIQWNKVHLIGTESQGLLIKRLLPGETDRSITVLSNNDHYPPFQIPKEEITGLALVIGIIRLE